MCTGIEIAAATALIAGTAYSAHTSMQQGKQAQLNAEAQSEQAQVDADAAASAAVVQADRIRKMARLQAGQARASLAGSGVEVDAGTALNINEEIYKNSEEDAALTIFNGENQRKRGYVDASNIALDGKQARAAGNSQAIGTVLGGAAQGGMAWKASAASKNGTTTQVGGSA